MRDNLSIYLSLIIPTYNEERRLPQTLESILKYLENQDYVYEIIISDDGSKDNTVNYVKSLPGYPDFIKVIELGKNIGKGWGIKNGVKLARGEYIIYSDADGSTPIEELEKLIAALDEGYDIAIASRALDVSNVKSKWYRKIIGGVFNIIIKLFLFGDIKDTQCGFKLFKAECAKKIFEINRLSGFCFDVEVLFLAKKLNYKIKEVPICWHAVSGSKINLVTDSISMFLDLIKIKIFYMLGKYKI